MDREKKECILLSAAIAFSRFGFKKASIDEIARHAGVGKGTIYLAASSKKDLFYQVLNREVRDWTADNAREIDTRIDADQLLMAVLDREVRSVDTRPLIGDLLTGRIRAVIPSWGTRLEELRRLARVNILEILRHGARQGRFRRDLDLEEVAVVLQDLEVTTLLFYNEGPNRLDVQSHRWETVVTALVEGLASKTVAQHVA